MHIHHLFAAAALAAAPTLAQTCVFFPNTPPGVDLQLGDDQTRVFPLPFAFPFNGGTVTEIGICSNGFVWLTNNTNADFSESETEFLNQDPRIALCWDDWNPGAGGAVYYNATATQASVIYQNVPEFGNAANLANMELVLSVTGQIDLYYDATMGVHSGTPIVGVSAGLGAAPNPISWTPPPASVTGGISPATGYQLFTAGGFNLSGTSTSLIPTSATDWTAINIPLGSCPPGPPPTLASSSTYGDGCPAPSSGTFFELFPGSTFDLNNSSWLFTFVGANTYALLPGNGYDNSYTAADILPQGDDTVVNCSTAAMGGFPWQGATLQALDVCSNGYVWMAPDTTADFSPSITEFASGNPRVAPVWADFTFVSAGTFYWTANSSFCMATWENVPTFGNAGSANTFQCKFFPNGDIEFNYQTVVNNSSLGADAITGLSGGASTPTQSIDFGASTGAIVDITPAMAAPLSMAALTNPSLGGSFDLEVRDVPAGWTLGAVVISFSQLSIPLTGLGMPGCTQYAGTETVLISLPAAATTFTQSLPIPFNVGFQGINLYSQGAAFVPGINPLGVAVSNGVQGTVGL